LSGEHLVVVAVEGLRLVTARIPQSFGYVCERTQRAGWLAFGYRPVQTVTLALIANELLSELLVVAEELLLSIGDLGQHADGNQFSVTDAARQHFLFAGSGVKRPLTGGVLAQRNWKRKIVGADIQNLIAFPVLAPTVHLAVGIHKPF